MLINIFSKRNNLLILAIFLLGLHSNFLFAQCDISVKWTEANGLQIRSDGTLNKTAANGWGNGTAVSLNTLPANTDGYVEIEITNYVSRYKIGFDNYKIYINGNKFYTEVFGTNTSTTTFTLGNKIQLAREGNHVRFYHNWELIHEEIFSDLGVQKISIDAYTKDRLLKDHWNTSFCIPFSLFLNKLSFQQSCDGSADPTVDIDVNLINGTPPYTFSWSNGEASEDLNQVAMGEYTVTVTDANDQTALRDFTIREPAENSVKWTEANGLQIRSDGTLNKTAANGWGNGTAVSLNTLPANTDGYVEIEITNYVSRYKIGFDNYKIYINGNKFYTEVFGTNTSTTTFTLGNKIQLAREGNHVRFYHNWELIHEEIFSDLGVQKISIDAYTKNRQLKDHWNTSFCKTKNYYAINSGLWNDPGTWSTSPGGPAVTTIPSAIDDVYIDGFVVSIDSDSKCDYLELSNINATTILLIQEGILEVNDRVNINDSNGAGKYPCELKIVNTGGIMVLE